MIPVSQPSKKTFDDVRAAFETRAVLRSSDMELQELLVAVGSETITDPAARAHAAEMSETMRQLMQSRRIEALRPKPSKAVWAALVFSLAALLCSAAVAYHFWAINAAPLDSVTSPGNVASSMPPDENQADTRTHLTVPELARRAPTLRTGTLQAWWAGEQARQIQKLEAQARRQTLAGDLEGAARSVSRADAIRSEVTALAADEKPPPLR